MVYLCRHKDAASAATLQRQVKIYPVIAVMHLQAFMFGIPRAYSGKGPRATLSVIKDKDGQTHLLFP